MKTPVHPNREAAELALNVAMAAGRCTEGYTRRYPTGWRALGFYAVKLPEGGTMAQAICV